MLWHKFTHTNMNYMLDYMIQRRHWLFFQSAHYRGLSLQHQALLPIDSADVLRLGLSPLLTAPNASTAPSLPPSLSFDAGALTMLDSAEVSH